MTEAAPSADRRARIWLGVYVACYAVFGALTVSFYPSYSFPGGDEGTYLSYALDPWHLISDFFEAYRPKEVMSPYAARLFLNPFSLVFSTFGFTYVGARLVVLLWGLLSLLLVYGIVARIRSGWFGLFAVALFSLSPPFLYYTHGIRPEGMFAMFLLLGAWLAIRRDDGPDPRTYAVVGLVSSSMLWVHYNGVLMPPIFFAVLWCCDRSRLSGRKVLAFAAGGAAFLALFTATTFLPAFSTVREFGILPVTFVSTNKIPVLHDSLAEMTASAWSVYSRYFRGEVLLEPRTHLLTSLLGALALGAVVYRSTWRERGLAALMVLLALAMIFLIPNRRDDYLFYPYPFVFVLAACLLAKIPHRRFGAAAAALVAIGVGAAYAVADTRTLVWAWEADVENQRTGEAIRRIVDELGGPESVTVMGTQEFHVFVPETRYRTFHSVIATRDLARTLELIRPDVVVVQLRALFALAYFLEPDSPRSPWQIAQDMRPILAAAGYEPSLDQLWWDGSRVVIFVRR